MKTRQAHPDVQRLLDEADKLPQCAAKDSLLERAASLAETLGDLDTAWSCRCAIISSSCTHQAPRFEKLFVSLAWCLAISDRDQERFPATRVLWEYKWAVTAAVNYASIPRAALERMLDDMDERFVRAGWGRRAGLHKRAQIFRDLGLRDRAAAMIDSWRSTPRDRGSDCLACEASTLSELLVSMNQVEAGIREARPIIAGRLKCSTVPHSTFGELLLPLVRLGKRREADELFERGRRLIAVMEESGATLSAPYMTYAAATCKAEHALGILNARFREGLALPSDLDRMNWFLHTSLAIEMLHSQGRLDQGSLPGACRTSFPHQSPGDLAWTLRKLAMSHAQSLDRRNGNLYQSHRLTGLADDWTKFAGSRRA